MTLDQFREALASTRLSLDARATAGALLVLVDGKPGAEAAREAGCSRQAVAASVKTILKATRTCPVCGSRLRKQRAKLVD